MGLAYGYEINETAPKDDPMVETVMTLVTLLSTALPPERGAILDVFPLPLPDGYRELHYGEVLPTRRGSQLKLSMSRLTGSRTKSDRRPWWCYCLTQPDHNDDYKKQEHAIKSTVATAFIAGLETSSSTLHAFILAVPLFLDSRRENEASLLQYCLSEDYTAYA